MNELISQSSQRIKLLPEHIIDQIKAGEVIERPSSLIKELIENSLDAGASKVDLIILENGLDLISIEDNGNGMTFADAPYAFLRHATSKIERFEDIYHLNSFGFRGEALASIAAVSRLTCITKPKGTEVGAKLILSEGQEELYIPYDENDHGTKIFVKDLFFNTPARLKFIKSKTSEKLALKKILNSFLLSNPFVEFSIKWDVAEKDIFRAIETPIQEENPLEKIKPRIAQVFFNKKDKVQDLAAFSNEYENYSVTGFFTKSSSPGAGHKHHYLFVNNRLFFDKNLHQGLTRNLEALWPSGQSGHYAVFLNVPAHEIDVNVHPHKTQVKFFKSDVVYTLLMGAIKERLVAEKKALTVAVPERPASMLDLIDQSQKKEIQLQRFQNQYEDFEEYAYEEALKKSGPSFFESDLAYGEETLSFLTFDKWVIQSIGNELYLLNRSDFFLYEIFQKFLKFKNNKENSPLPLLISEPLKGLIRPDATVLESLKHCGFEVDALESDYYVLRTTNLAIGPSLAAIFVKIYFALHSQKLNPDNYFSWKKISGSFATELKTIHLKQSPRDELKRIQKYSLQDLLNEKCLIQLTSEVLESIGTNSHGSK